MKWGFIDKDGFRPKLFILPYKVTCADGSTYWTCCKQIEVKKGSYNYWYDRNQNRYESGFNILINM